MDDWVSACRRVEVAGVRCKGRNRKTWKECVDDDMKVLGLHPEWAVFREHKSGDDWVSPCRPVEMWWWRG